MNRQIVLKPRLSEKVYAQSEATNTYVFDVAHTANKHDVAAAVKKEYGVSPKSVRTARTKGKSLRSVRASGRSVKRFNRKDIKKAYVTLNEDDKLPIFAAVEESAKKPAGKEKK